jgi:REP element-mobilizing transposase RayT
MKYDPQKHHRQSIRIKGYDYSQAGAYFLTLCTYQRQCLFGEIVGGAMQLNPYGQVVEDCWQAIPEHFPRIALDVFVVMPNHIHGILLITDEGRGKA